jgi:hypothetical protein
MGKGRWKERSVEIFERSVEIINARTQGGSMTVLERLKMVNEGQRMVKEIV